MIRIDIVILQSQFRFGKVILILKYKFWDEK